MSDNKNDWTPEMLVAFNDLYRAEPELSFAKIAAQMSSAFDITLTSNACIGKAHRLGLPMRGHRTGPRKPHVAHVKRPKMVKVRVDAPIAPIEEPPAPAEEGLSIYQLRDGVCHWPGGGFRGRPPFRYCGNPASSGVPYCKPHMRLAHPHMRD